MKTKKATLSERAVLRFADELPLSHLRLSPVEWQARHRAKFIDKAVGRRVREVLDLGIEYGECMNMLESDERMGDVPRPQTLKRRDEIKAILKSRYGVRL